MRVGVTRIVFLMTLATLGCGTTAPKGYAEIVIDTGEAKRSASLGPGDVFEVRVHSHRDLTGTHRISPDGAIDFPLVGRIVVAGRQSGEIAALIRQRLGDGYLREPSVTVFVKEFNSKKIFVLGQVKKPGMFDYENRMSIVQAIALAGGFTGLAQENYAIVKRVTNGIEQRIPIPVEEIMTASAKNFILQPGDIVFVPESVL